jgi:hypothetical protein
MTRNCILISLIFLVYTSAYSQQIKIITKDSVVQEGRAQITTDRYIKINDQEYKYEDIDRIIVDVYEPRFHEVYAKFQRLSTLVMNADDAQPYVTKAILNEGIMAYSQVVPLIGSADDLYSKAKQFVAETYNNPEYVTVLDDDNQRLVIVRAMEKVSFHEMYYTLRIQTKENRYRLEISEVYYMVYTSTKSYPQELFLKTEYYRKNGKPKSEYETILNGSLLTIKRLAERIISTMETIKSDDDW